MAFMVILATFFLTASRPVQAGEADVIPLPTGAAGPAVPSGALRPPSDAAAVPELPNPSALPPPLPELMLPSMGSRSVQVTVHPTGAGTVPSLTTVPAAPGGVQTTRVVVSPTPLTAVAPRPSGVVPLPPVGSIASPLAASATPPPPVPVTSPLVGALVSGQRESYAAPPVQAVPAVSAAVQEPLYYPEASAMHGTAMEPVPARPYMPENRPEPEYRIEAESRVDQGTHIAPGSRVEPGSRPGRRQRAEPRYDPLPLRFADMDQYDRIAMEPYRDRYDSLSLDEKVALYGQQFESMHGRPPRFDPRATGEAPPEPEHRPDRQDRRDQAEFTGSEQYDVLPLRFADMDEYDQIAMEPYRDRYDRLSVGEKASLYGQQFEFMRGRPPRFDPRVSVEAERFQAASQATDIVAKRQSMYKPALEKPRAPRPEERSQALLGALPGPWEQEAPPPPPVPEEPTYHDFDSDNRMENLRQGWNAMDVIRGRRQR